MLTKIFGSNGNVEGTLAITFDFTILGYASLVTYE